MAAKPDSHEALYNWGLELSRLAALSGGDAAAERALREQACGRYEAAVAAKPDDHQALNNWGNELSRLAALSGGDAAAERALREQACGRYEAAVAAKPDDHQALYWWGQQFVMLGSLAHADSKEQLQLWDEAAQLFTRSAELEGRPVIELYNYSCLLALRRQDSEALASLDACLVAGTITVDHVREDPDWERLRSSPELMALLEKHGSS